MLKSLACSSSSSEDVMGTRVLVILLLATSTLALDVDEDTSKKSHRNSRLLPVFQVIRFPNDPCIVSGGSKNGTCYTTEECSSRGGVASGSCAEGFGTCCVFTVGCGSTSSENCTYFEVSETTAGTLTGQCRATICKSSPDVCQIRLDMTTFTITGPTTVTVAFAAILNGNVIDTATTGTGQDVSRRGTCLTDIFTVSNQNTLPVICGENAGEHVYFEASDSCNSLDFQLGNQVVGVTAFATRTWSIKVNQIPCSDVNRAPIGCDQYYYGSTLGFFESFNFNSNNGRHLALQHQTICFRRELGFCRICFSADAVIDVSLGGVLSPVANYDVLVAGTACCAYGPDGKATDEGGYDCLMIPGAINAASALKPASQCGHGKGLVTAKSGNSATICTRSYPFKFEFFSDGYEDAEAAIGESATDNAAGAPVQTGFKVRYFQTAC